MKNSILHVFIGLLLTASLSACAGEQEQAVEAGEAESSAASEMMQVSDPDTTGAAIWGHLQSAEYRENWSYWPGKGELYTGQEPHGMLLTTYVNDPALEAVSTSAGEMPEGAVIVKENYAPDSTLKSITVMFKKAGYNPDHNNWFWSKHNPDGSLATNPEGMALEGRLPPCQACHSSGVDYTRTAGLGAEDM